MADVPNLTQLQETKLKAKLKLNLVGKFLLNLQL